MTVLSTSEVDRSMMTVQCDLCSIPMIITNREPVIAALGWALVSRGGPYDACPACLEQHPRPAPGQRRRELAADAFGPGRMPDLFIIGAAKSGTTSMHNYLDTLPDVFMTPWKEMRYFTDPDHEQWREAYCRAFDSPATIVGESSTMYTRSPALPGVAERMAKTVPDAKLVYLVRDPVRRALASYVEERFHGLEPRSPEEAFADLDDPYNPYVSASRYAEQIRPYLDNYPREQIHVVELGALRLAPVRTMHDVLDFLGIGSDLTPDATVHYNRRASKVEYGRYGARARRGVVGRSVRRLPEPVRRRVTAPARRLLTRPIPPPALSDRTMARLRAALAPDTAEFRELIGSDLLDLDY